MTLFTSNYLEELPDDIKTLIYNHVYKNRYSSVLKELLSNLSNRKHYKNLIHFLAYQEEPKLNLVHYLAHYIHSRNIHESRSRRHTEGSTEGSIIFLYKKHLMTTNIAASAANRIYKIKIPLNLYAYLDKVIAKTFIRFMKKSTHSWNLTYAIYIDDVGEYFILEREKPFACFADLYLMLLSFWQFIRIRLYDFYELHKEAYNIHVGNLLKSDYDTGLYMWFDGNTDATQHSQHSQHSSLLTPLTNNLIKMKSENASLYRKIIRQRNNIHKSECLYINFEIRNNIEGYTIKDDAIIMRLKEM
jgi:hypothetical protein